MFGYIYINYLNIFYIDAVTGWEYLFDESLIIRILRNGVVEHVNVGDLLILFELENGFETLNLIPGKIQNS